MPEPRAARPDPDLPSPVEDIRGSEQTMVLVRWAGVAFALIQIMFYEQPYPPGVERSALLLTGALAVANLIISLLALRDLSLVQARLLSLGAMTVDILVVSGFVWLYAFDQVSAWGSAF